MFLWHMHIQIDIHFKFVYIILKVNFSHYFIVMFVSRSNEQDQNII